MNKKLNTITILLLLTFCFTGCEEKQEELLPLDTIAVQEESTRPDAVPTVPPPEEVHPETALPLTCFIHICGAVVNPGVYELSAGSRIFECVEAAGGFTENAGQDGINLAMPVEDGSRIRIPTIDEMERVREESLRSGNPSSDITNLTAADLIQPGNTQSETAESKVNINTASLETLCTLPGIGTAKAESIIAYREQTGRFGRIEDIMNVEGIKSGLFHKISERITV